MTFSCCLATPVGPLTLTATERALTAVDFGAADGLPAAAWPPVLHRAAQELGEYFAGRRTVFTVPLAPQGTPFQQEVWAALQRIPYGTTCSYADLARAIGRPKACRAVGMANHRNPIPILIPCHRVVGADGSLTGYASGLVIKSCLLQLELRFR